MAGQLHDLGSFRFDSSALTLERGGEFVRLPQKALELLALLAEKPGTLVSHRALRETLWPEGFVEDKNLGQQIYVLRQALAAEPRVRIENVPRRGYRLAVAAPKSPARAARRRTGILALRWAAFAFAAAFSLGATSSVDVSPQPSPLPTVAAEDYARGMLQWERRDDLALRNAEREFRRTIALAPNDARGYAGLALVDVIRADDEDSSAASKRFLADTARNARNALARDRRNADAYAALGLAQNVAHDPRKANALLARAEMLDPHNVYAHLWRGMILLSEGELNEALPELARAEQYGPNSKRAAYWMGRGEYGLHDFARAAEQFRTALEIDPNDDLAALGLFEIDEARHDYAGAERRLDALKGRLARKEWRPMAAMLEALRGEVTRARIDLAAVDRSHVDDLDGLDLAAAQLALGDRRGALATLRAIKPEARVMAASVLRLDPRYEALARLARENGAASD